MLLVRLNLGLGSHDDASASRLVGVAHALQSEDVGSRREVGRLDVLHESVRVYVRVVDVCAATVDDLAEVVRRYIGSHADGDAVSSVHEEVRNLRRHYGRLLERVVEVVHHVDGLLLKVVHDVLAHLGESALRVTHGGCGVSVYGTEVALSVHEGVAHVPVLRQSDECSVYGGVAVRVVLTEHLSDYACALLVGLCAGIADAEHTVEDASVYRFESVAHVRQGACHNHRHGVVDVARLHLVLNIYLEDSVVVISLCFVHFLVFSRF